LTSMGMQLTEQQTIRNQTTALCKEQITTLRGYGWVVLVILSFSAVLRISLAATAAAVAPDAARFYLPMAQSVANGSLASGMDPGISPLYPILAGYLAKIVGDVEWSCRIVSILAGIGTVIFGMLLARTMFGRWPALLAAMLIGFHPYLTRFSADVGPDSLAVFLFAASAFLLVRYLNQPAIWQIIPLGLALVLLSLTRPEGIVYAALMLVVAIFVQIKKGRRFQRRQLIHTLILIMICLAGLTVYLIITHAKTSSWTIDSRHITWPKRLWASVQSGSFDYGQIRVWRRQGLQAIPDTLESITSGLGPVGILFAPVGLVLARRRHIKPANGVLIVLFVATILVPAIGNRISRRYLLTAAVLWQVWAAFGLSNTIALLNHRFAREPGQGPAQVQARLFRPMLTALVLLAVMHLPWSLTRLHKSRVYDRNAGQWTLAQYGANRRIMASTAIAPWYAHGRYVRAKPIRRGKKRYRRFTSQIRHTRTEFLVIDKYTNNWLPDLDSWLKDGLLDCWPIIYSRDYPDRKGKAKTVLRILDTRQR